MFVCVCVYVCVCVHMSSMCGSMYVSYMLYMLFKYLTHHSINLLIGQFWHKLQ